MGEHLCDRTTIRSGDESVFRLGNVFGHLNGVLAYRAKRTGQFFSTVRIHLDTSFGEFCTQRQAAGFDAPELQAVTRRPGLFLKCGAGFYDSPTAYHPFPFRCADVASALTRCLPFVRGRPSEAVPQSNCFKMWQEEL